MRNSLTPLSPNEQTALAHLEELFETADDSVARETAIDHLVDAGFVRGAAIDLTTQLRLKGYLYAVENDLHLTDP